jgi:lysozyme
MNSHLRTSGEGVNLIASFEGLRLRAYDDGKGVLTIGYGHTLYVKPGQVITKQQALRLLRDDLLAAEASVKRLVRIRLTQRQFDALVSATFNLGPIILKEHESHFARLLNTRHFARAANHLLDWSDPGRSTHAGLLRRRKAERRMFLRGCPRRFRIAARTGVR